MARYVKVRGGVAVQYPITESDLKAATGEDYPNGATVRDYLAYGCHQVTPSDYDSTQDSVDEILPVLVGVNWTAQWETRAYTAAEFEAYQELTKVEVSSLASISREIGVEVDGLKVATDPESTSLLVGAKQGGKPNRKVIGTNGRATLTKAQFDNLVDAVDDLIQNVFDREYDLGELIDAATTKAEIDAIDIKGGWPT